MTAPSVQDFLAEILSDSEPVGELRHEYDPQKAREYYLRTRKLKGRKKGSSDHNNGHRARTANSLRARQAAAKKAKSERLKKIAEERVNKLKARLAKLEAVLAELTKQAKQRSGVKTSEGTGSTKESPAEAAKKRRDAKPLTSSQKNKAAKAAKERREKEGGDPSLSTQTKELDAKIKKVQERIKKMKAQLAIARKSGQGSNTKSKTASNGR